MSLSGLIANYGYAALFVGTLLEGETMLILAGFAVHQGYLQLPWVIVIAMLGGFFGDQIYFWIGREHGVWVLSRFPKIIPVVTRVNVLMERYQEVLIIGIRFLYGVRTVGPLTFGMSAVPAWRFVLFNAFGAALWAICIGSAGYLFGQAMEIWLHDLKKIEEMLLLVLLSGGLIFWAWRRWQFHRNCGAKKADGHLPRPHP